MPKEQTNSAKPPRVGAGLDLHLEVTRPRVRQSLMAALREAVRSGRLPPGARLPASRGLAQDLGIARGTVTECYAELVAEGWFTARQGASTRVAMRAPVGSERPTTDPDDSPAITGLVPGSSDFADFPRGAWLSAARRAFSIAPHSSFGYGEPAGLPALRAALADYLSRVRGVAAEPQHIIICAGFHHGLGLVAGALAAGGASAIAVEAYGLDLYRDVLERSRLDTPVLDVDESGALTTGLGDIRADAVLLTPAHQFPTGVALSPEGRGIALDWARTTGGFILEDDYDGEFRYDRAPIGALQSLDPQHVVYFGTSSKSLAPALRLGWIVAPPYLRAALLEEKGPVELVSVLDQLTLAEFIRSGDYDRHIRSRRAKYRRRREQLVAALDQRAPRVRVAGMKAGLQVLLELPRDTEQAAVEIATNRGLTVSGLARFKRADQFATVDDREGLVVNYSAIADSAWDSALDILIDAVREATLVFGS